MKEHLLWRIYGHVYDGLLGFYPYRSLVHDVVEAVAAKPGMNVLDLGCGTGNILFAITPDANLHGIDASRSMVGVAKRKFARAGRAADIKHDDLLQGLSHVRSGSIDRAVLCNVVYTLSAKSRKQLWHEVSRVLAPGGYAVVANPDATGSGSLIDYHTANDHWWRLLAPKLVAVWLIDKRIDRTIKKGKFTLHSADQLMRECEDSGLHCHNLGRTYGSPHDGIDVLMRVSKR